MLCGGPIGYAGWMWIDVVWYNTLIRGYSESESPSNALSIFIHMLRLEEKIVRAITIVKLVPTMPTIEKAGRIPKRRRLDKDPKLLDYERMQLATFLEGEYFTSKFRRLLPSMANSMLNNPDWSLLQKFSAPTMDPSLDFDVKAALDSEFAALCVWFLYIDVADNLKVQIFMFWFFVRVRSVLISAFGFFPRHCVVYFRLSIIFKDISFFDSETLGDLTSRLRADFQQMSCIIGRDINLILRNLLQGGGSLIYLLVLSLPLGLCALAICSTLSIAMLVYGQYQKKSSKLVQDIGAYCNEVAQETFSLIRTVRVYGTEEQELSRYTNWLDKLADTNLRQSAAYGLWNFSFYTLYHSMQIK